MRFLPQSAFIRRFAHRTPSLAALLACFLCLAPALSHSQQDVLTYHNDNSRNGLDSKETALTLANVNSATFGKLFTVTVDGLVDAQPLYLHGVSTSSGTHNLLIVVSEHDSAYAFDADSGAPIWQVTDDNTSSAWYQQADSSYPTQSGGVITCNCTITSSNGNFAWQEWCLATGSGGITSGDHLSATATGVVLLNHKVASLGTKASGASWVFTATVTES